MQTNRAAPRNYRPEMLPGVDPDQLTQEDVDELTALIQPELERAGTWRAWLCCCLRCLFPCICCVEAYRSYRVSKNVMKRVEARAAQAQAQAQAQLRARAQAEAEAQAQARAQAEARGEVPALAQHYMVGRI